MAQKTIEEQVADTMQSSRARVAAALALGADREYQTGLDKLALEQGRRRLRVQAQLATETARAKVAQQVALAKAKLGLSSGDKATLAKASGIGKATDKSVKSNGKSKSAPATEQTGAQTDQTVQ